MVEMTGFEPATSASRTQRSTKLSHISEYEFRYSETLLKYNTITRQKNQELFAKSFAFGRVILKNKPLQYLQGRLVGVEGFEPSKWWSQNPLPYRLATPQ